MDIQEIHKNLLELVVQFDKICVDNNIHYTLHGGSLLGAIREHGFIPWDDDIDTAMVRSEFKKLEEVLKDNTDFYIYGNIKKQFRRKNDDAMWIDIFVCDYISNSVEKKRKLLSLTVLDIMYKDKNSIKLVNFKKYSMPKRVAYKIAYFIGKAVPRNFKVREYNKIAEYKYLGNKEYMHRSNDQFSGRAKVFPSAWMDGYMRVPFENLELSVISNYDEMLCYCYGKDYMTPIRDARNHEVHEIVRGEVRL